jgi:hypothetical protein
MDDKSYTIRIRKRWLRTALVVAATALTVAPLTAVASHSFTDVPDSNTFHSDIEWLKNADVTRGCNPPANTRFCPKDNVTREQMAAFMNRLADNRVVDAGRLDGMTLEEVIGSGTKVQTFEFTVSASDWSANLHYGSNNIFREYFIPESVTGGIDVGSFFHDGGTIVMYANAHHEGGGSLGGWHLLPYLYRSADGIGVKTVLLARRGSVAITQTTVGWDHISILDANLPDEVEYRIALISP